MEEGDIKIVERNENELRLEIEGDENTLLAPLTSKLLENENVDMATNSMTHSLLGNSILYVKMKKGDALEALESAATSLASTLKSLGGNTGRQ